MAKWLTHPAYIRARDRLVLRLRAHVDTFKHLPPIVFLCGAHRSERRDRLAEYLKRHNSHIRFFYAEHVWEQIAHLKRLNALQMEEQLARLADLVIIIVESPGTFAELGAFAANRELRGKLLPVLDKKYKNEASFINTGPIRWIDKESRYKPVIFGDFQAFLRNLEQIAIRLTRIPTTGRPGKSTEDLSLGAKPKNLLYLLCDILAVVGPATSEECADIISRVLDDEPTLDVPTLLGLAHTLGLVEATGGAEDGPLYHRSPIGGRLIAYQHKRMFDLGLERARFLSSMQKVRGHWAADGISQVVQHA